MITRAEKIQPYILTLIKEHLSKKKKMDHIQPLLNHQKIKLQLKKPPKKLKQ